MIDRVLDVVIRRYRGYTLDGTLCKLKYIVNRLVHLPFRWLHHSYYLSMAWYKSPFDLSKCVFVAPDGFRFTAETWEVHLALRLHENHLLSLIESLLGKGSVFIDVGAHIGTFAIRAARIVGANGLVIAFEPDPRNLYHLYNNIRLNNVSNIVVIPLPAHSADGRKITLNIAEGTGHTSLVYDRSAIAKLTVITTTVDSVVAKLRLGRVDLVKVDVEGAELEVLAGMQNTIDEHRPVVIVETHGEHQYRRLPDYLPGYRLRELYRSEIDPWNRHILAEPAR